MFFLLIYFFFAFGFFFSFGFSLLRFAFFLFIRAYSGAIFKLEDRYPILLNVIFVTLTYSSGMPILYPIAACTFGIMYMTDKIALLRLYNRPPKYKASLAKLTLDILPIALVLHLCIAVWMYGASSFASHPVTYGNTTYTMSIVSTDIDGNSTMPMVDQVR